MSIFYVKVCFDDRCDHLSCDQFFTKRSRSSNCNISFKIFHYNIFIILNLRNKSRYIGKKNMCRKRRIGKKLLLILIFKWCLPWNNNTTKCTFMQFFRLMIFLLYSSGNAGVSNRKRYSPYLMCNCN